MATIGSVVTLPVFRPLIGMDKDEITAEAQRLGTYPISIIEDQDCCQLFTPKHPATKARREDIEAAERALADRRICAAGGRGGGRGRLQLPGDKTAYVLSRRLAGPFKCYNKRLLSGRKSWPFKVSVRRSKKFSATKRRACCSINARRSRKRRCIFPGPITSSASTASPIARRACWAASSRCLSHGRLAGTGYVSILPVDQGIEHSAGASFAPNPMYFDPENIVKLAIEGGCNAVASTLGVLGSVARKYAHKIPFLLKLNHNEFHLVSERLRSDQVRERAAGVRHGRAGRGRDDLLRVGGIEAADRRSVGVVPAGARARHVHGAVVLPAQPGVQDEGEGLSRRGGPDRPGQSPRRDDRSRHHQAEAAGEQRRLQRA